MHNELIAVYSWKPGCWRKVTLILEVSNKDNCVLYHTFLGL